MNEHGGRPGRARDERGPQASNERRAELAAHLVAVRARIETACAAAARDPAEVTLIAVTKTWPAQDVAHLAALGVADVAENRDAEAAAKTAACAGIPGLRWHFVGQVQTNKARSVARYADVVHSVDRPRLVSALDAAALEAGRRLDVLLQVNLDPPADSAAGRGGVLPARLSELAGVVAATQSLRLRGVMAVAPPGAPPMPAFERLAELAARLRADHPAARWISAGMTADLPEAVRCGATHVRVGSGLLGTRPRAR